MNVYSKLIASIACALAPIIVNAQDLFDPNIKWSEGIEKKTFQLYPTFVGMFGNSMVSVSSGSYNKLFIDEYNAQDLTAKDKHKINLKYEGNSLEVYTQFTFGNELLFVTNYRNKSTKTKHFFIQKYLGGEDLGKPKLIGSMGWEDVPGLFASKSKMGDQYEAYNAMKTAISADKKHLAVIFPSMAILETGDENKWTAIVYDENLEEQWKHEFILPNKELYLDKVVLSNDGTVYCSVIEGLVAKSYKVAYANVLQGSVYGEAYHLMIVDGKNQNSEIYDLSLKERSIIAYSMNLLDDEVVFYGLTGSGITGNFAEGVFFKKVNRQGEDLFYTEEKFSEELISHNEETNPKSIVGQGGSDKMQRNFRLDDIVITKNGDLIFLAEQFNFYISYQTTGGPQGGSTATPNYVYGDILAISCSAEGNVNWMNRIVKYQHSTVEAGYFSSYFPMTKDENLHLLFNDTEYYANYAELKDADMKTKRDAKRNWVTSEVILMPSGDFERFVIIDEIQKKDMNFMAPAFAVLCSDNTLLSLGMNRKKKGLLSYDDTIIVGKMKLNND